MLSIFVVVTLYLSLASTSPVNRYASDNRNQLISTVSFDKTIDALVYCGSHDRNKNNAVSMEPSNTGYAFQKSIKSKWDWENTKTKSEKIDYQSITTYPSDAHNGEYSFAYSSDYPSGYSSDYFESTSTISLYKHHLSIHTPGSTASASSVSQADKDIIEKSLNVFAEIDDQSNITQCQKCKERLGYGKHMAFERPDLVPNVFERYCIASKLSSTAGCHNAYHSWSANSTFMGTDFTNLLTLLNTNSLDAEYFCYYRFAGQCDIPRTPENISLAYLWNNVKPHKAHFAPIPNSKDTFNVIHVSDLHVEQDYAVGSEANCTTSMCCTVNKHSKRKNNKDKDKYTNLYEGSYYDNNDIFHLGLPVSNDNSSIYTPATTFGSYMCDSPEVLINSTFLSIRNLQKKNGPNFKFAIFTGDMVDHDGAQYISLGMSKKSEEIIFRDAKHGLRDIPLYPALGNHDSFPYGQIAPEKTKFTNRFTWNTDLMAEMWSSYNWIGKKQVDQVKRHYAGYSISTKMGLKIISMNSNAFYYGNIYSYWNMVEDSDPFGSFKFLVDELLDAESKDQRVWILYHIPMSNNILPVQSKLFTEIVERFSPYTIAGIFNGHTHRDEFQILFKGDGTNYIQKTKENALNVAYIGQSITPLAKYNPGWRYYEVDKKTFSVLNIHNYYVDLESTFGTNGSEPVWEYEYSARSAYEIDWPESSPLNATYWALVAQKMKTNSTILQMYENYAGRLSPFTTNCEDGTNCARNWCYVTSFSYDQEQNCYSAENVAHS